MRPEDLIKFGLIPEFLGRLPVIATLNELNESSLIRILKEPKNALIKQFQKLFELEGVNLRMTDSACKIMLELWKIRGNKDDLSRRNGRGERI